MRNTVKTKFEQILADNKYKIYRICKIYAVSPIEPEDLFQEVTFHIWKAFPSFDSRSDVNTWVYRIALNVCIRYKNKLDNRNAKMVRLESILFEHASAIPDTLQLEKSKALHSCIQLLNEIDQTVVILSLDGLSYNKIAKITGLTENHIAVKMKRMRKVLLSCITTKLTSDE